MQSQVVNFVNFVISFSLGVSSRSYKQVKIENARSYTTFSKCVYMFNLVPIQISFN